MKCLKLTMWGLLALIATSYACSCLPPNLPNSFNTQENFIQGQVLSVTPGASEFDDIVMSIRVLRAYNGCLERGQNINITTPGNTAACGVVWSVGQVWYFGFDADNTVHLCDWMKMAGDMTLGDTRFLNLHRRCCGDECVCNKNNEVECEIAPCSAPEQCGVRTAAILDCQENTCGGCKAEFFSEVNGNLVNCPQKCREELARAQACEEDSDCIDEIPFGECGCPNKVINAVRSAEEFAVLYASCGDRNCRCGPDCAPGSCDGINPPTGESAQCGDGSIGGVTGRCIQLRGVCNWQSEPCERINRYACINGKCGWKHRNPPGYYPTRVPVATLTPTFTPSASPTQSSVSSESQSSESQSSSDSLDA